MTFTAEQVERIVFEVIRRLRLLESGAAAGMAVTPNSNGRDLSLKERVITMRSIEGRVSGVKRLVVPSRAIVTPAVKDELKDRQIELIRETAV